MKKTIPAKNVDEYIKGQPKDVAVALEKLRQVIKSASPKAEEVISYQIPVYKYLGFLVCFAAYPKHCSFFVVKKIILKIFEKELEPFKTTGTTIHFTPAKPIPATLVKKIVRLRIKQNEEEYAAKQKTKPKKVH